MLVVHVFILWRGRVARRHTSAQRCLDFTAFILSYLGYVKDKKLPKKWGYARCYSSKIRERQRLRVSSNSILILPRPPTCMYHVSLGNNHYIVTVISCCFEFLCFILTKALLLCFGLIRIPNFMRYARYCLQPNSYLQTVTNIKLEILDLFFEHSAYDNYNYV